MNQGSTSNADSLFTSRTPEMGKPLNQFDAMHWAMAHGLCAALKGDARWAVLCALYLHLPNVNPGLTRITEMTGLAPKTVKRARRSLRQVGLIAYNDHNGGSREDRTQYHIADIRRLEVVAAIKGKLNQGLADGGSYDPGNSDPGHHDPCTGVVVSTDGGSCDPGTGVMVTPKGTNGSSQLSFQLSSDSDEPAPQASSAPPLITFDCVGGKTSKQLKWDLTQQYVDSLTAAFPAVDVLAECRKAHLFTIAKPLKRKTNHGMPAFLMRWMSFAQDRGGRPGQSSYAPTAGTGGDRLRKTLEQSL